MKQNLIQCRCSVRNCQNIKILGHVKWTKIKNLAALPTGLKEEICPSCLLDVAIESNVLSQKQPS